MALRPGQDGRTLTVRGSARVPQCVPVGQILVMDLRPLHPLLRFPKGVGLQTVSVPIADAVGAIGFRSDREPRRCRDGVSHGRVRQLLIGLLPHPASATACETTRCSPRDQPPPRAGPGGWDDAVRFTLRDVHRLDRRPSPVADRRSSGRGRGHGCLLHLAIEASEGALSHRGWSGPRRRWSPG